MIKKQCTKSTFLSKECGSAIPLTKAEIKMFVLFNDIKNLIINFSKSIKERNIKKDKKRGTSVNLHEA